jgi:superfamily II DNA/RNA helicase
MVTSSKSFEELNLNAALLEALRARGFVTPTPIQSQAIPVVLSGRDLMASAQTGTGKTAAFVLPALQRLLTPSAFPGSGPRVLVLTPTRELAAQINDDIRTFGRFCRLTAGNVLGGVSYGPQIRLLQQPLDLLVATPGRLMDHMREGRVNFSRLEVLVLDEADRMLDMGFIRDVQTIAAATPSHRQTLLFSATLEGRVLKVAQAIMRQPARIQLAGNKERHAGIRQHVYQADSPEHKHRLLSHHLANRDLTQALVFTATKRKASRLAKTLAGEGHRSTALHGDMSQGARRRAVDHLRLGKVRILVATDVAARGLDIRTISHVINFDLPMVAEDYIHRIGRTGRAGDMGTAITLVGPEDWSKLADIERLTGRQLEREFVTGLEPVNPEPRLDLRPGSRGQERGRGLGFGNGNGNRKGERSKSRGGFGFDSRSRPGGPRSTAGRGGGRFSRYHP